MINEKEIIIKECPNKLVFGADYMSINACASCLKVSGCKEIKSKYRISNVDQLISLSKARDYIKEIWGRTWSWPYLIKRNALMYGLIDKKDGDKYKIWKISYKNIYRLMNIPLWKTLYTRRLRVEKE